MRVEKIELIGFKSFCEKTVFNLHPGITCIVGPNGCGKSNVVDSFKWVLGEQSAKSLRGENMQEVIFAGSQTKKPKGMAEAALHISGMGGADNGKESLTTVTRRLYRSGDSDYMLNGSVCRLKDIRDLFLDTGLEVKSYSILEQDRISAILSAKPDERRFIIEEVAGVVKYRVRRNEAQSKLDSSRRNLERINDVINEIKRQINSLDRQVKKAERYKRLMEELRAVEIKIARHDYASLGEALEAIMGRYESLSEADTARRAELTRRENELETGRIALLEKEKALDGLQSELQSTEREMAEIERALAVLNTERDSLREYIARLDAQAVENSNKINASNERIAEIAASRSALDSELSALKDELGERAESLSADESGIAELELALEGKRREAFKASDNLSHARNEHNRQSAYLDNLKKKAEMSDKESGELTSHMEETTARLRQTETSIIEKKNEILSLTEEKEVLTKAVSAHKDAIEALRADIVKEREGLASTLSRLESLMEMVSAGSDEIGKEINIVASIADAIEVPERYELAIESALSEIITGFILPAYDDVKLAVKVLKDKGMGRTAFIPLGDTDPFIARVADPLPEGAIAWAADLVKAKDEFSSVIKGLLGGVVIAGDLDAALKIKGYAVATLEGEVMETSGAVIAGKSRGILTLKRQIRELEGEAEGRKSKVAGMQGSLDAAILTLQEKESVLQAAGQKAVEAERDLSVLTVTAEKQSEEMERANRKLAYLRPEREEIDRETGEIKVLLSSKEAEIAALEEERKRVEEAIASFQAEIGGKKSVYEQKRAESMDLRISINSCRERLNSLENEKETIERLIAELKDKTIYINVEKERTEEKIKEKEAESAGRSETLKGLAVQAAGLSARILADKEVISGDSEGLMSAERAIKELRVEIDAMARQLSELDVEKAEHRLKMENLKGNIFNTYNADIDTIETEAVTDEDRERLPEIKSKIEALGPVSLGSLEEHEELRQRYEFLTKQQEDLVRSIAELEEAIRRINGTTRKKLSEAYEALRTKFSEVFISMFGGGKAEIVLTDPENMLETGIDIVAQPPGKKLQNINLLSGGEKTLTALALLFASFLIKPTPLCILDEADAALDESNTERFAQMLREISKGIQFIVVTHNKVTMEAADYIYGITMEEPGISKVISMQLTA